MSCRLSALPVLRLFTLAGYAQQALPTAFKAPAPLIGLHGLWGSRLSDLVAYECTKLANCFGMNPEKKKLAYFRLFPCKHALAALI
ncbi:hypothetical protein ApDm4_0279 [Acetobacter pomorum]|nr:hypothetical protein ApDm4_0279 [Acetobacter pomorum]